MISEVIEIPDNQVFRLITLFFGAHLRLYYILLFYVGKRRPLFYAVGASGGILHPRGRGVNG